MSILQSLENKKGIAVDMMYEQGLIVSVSRRELPDSLRTEFDQIADRVKMLVGKKENQKV